MATSNCVELKLNNFRSSLGLCSGPVLSHFLEASPSLHLLEFEYFAFNGAECRALAALTRTDLKVTFEWCSFDTRGAEDTFIEWLRNSQVVTKLEVCQMGDGIVSALSGNSSIKSLAVHTFRGDAFISYLAGALSGNKGIEKLDVFLTEEALSLLLRSLWAHPRIQSVSLRFNLRSHRLSAASKLSMMNEVMRLVQCNTVVHTIEVLPDHAKDEEFFQNSIEPRLEMNRSRFEDHRQALTRVDHAIRGQLLGRALHVVRNNPDLLFQFLSENVPAFVDSPENGPVPSLVPSPLPLSAWVPYQRPLVIVQRSVPITIGALRSTSKGKGGEEASEDTDVPKKCTCVNVGVVVLVMIISVAAAGSSSSAVASELWPLSG
jgi:hypothetical protein